MTQRLKIFQTLSTTQTRIQLFGSSDWLYSLFFIYFRYYQAFPFPLCFLYDANNYGIKLCGVLRYNDRSVDILFDIWFNPTGIAAASTGNLLTFRKIFRPMAFDSSVVVAPASIFRKIFIVLILSREFSFPDLSVSYIAE